MSSSARCIKSGVYCQVDPKGACRRCKSYKMGCSLMPVNPSTGKTDRHKYTEEQYREFRRLQLQKKASKGKQPARKPSYDEQAEASGLTPSPSTLLPPLGQTLNSTSSPVDTTANAADTREDSHAGSSPGLPDDEHADEPAANTRAFANAPEPAAAAPTRMVTSAPHPSPSIEPSPRLQAGSCWQPSRGDQSRASDDGGNAAANYRELMERVDAIEKWQRKVECLVKKIGI